MLNMLSQADIISRHVISRAFPPIFQIAKLPWNLRWNESTDPPTSGAQDGVLYGSFSYLSQKDWILRCMCCVFQMSSTHQKVMI